MILFTPRTLVQCLMVITPFSSVFANDINQTESAINVVPDTTTVATVDRTNKYRTVVLPFYDPSIKAGVSITPLYAFYPDADDQVSDASTLAFPMIYTTNDSYVAKLSGDIILYEDYFRIAFESGFTSSNLTLSNIDLNREVKDLTADFLFQVFDDFYVGIGTTYTSTRYTADDSDQQDDLTLVGFNEEYQSDTGYRLIMQWDTREHFYYPYSGFLWKLRYEGHDEWLGNDADSTYSSLFTDYRYFYSIDEDINRIIATKIVGRYLMNAEDAPSSAFSNYGRQGREVQRGYAVGDYVASNMFNVEVEYRHRFTNTGNAIMDKSAAVGIASFGKSFGEQLTGNTEDFRDSDWLTAIGVGYRYAIMPYERLNLKFDLMYNSDSEVIAYFGFGENI